MQGLSPERLEASQPLHTTTPEGTPEDSPRLGEIPLVTLPHVDISDIPEVFTPPPQVAPTDPLVEFRITNTVEDYHIRRGERPVGRFNPSEETVVPSSESTIGPSHGVVGQDPFWSSDFRRVLFGTESTPVYEINPPVSPEPETAPDTTTYHFILPPEMAHLAINSSVQTGITATTLPPINTQRTPEANLNLPPGYHALNPSLNVSHPTPPQTPAGSPSGPQFPGHSIPGFVPTLPPQFFPPGNLNPNPSGTIPTVAPNLQFPVGGQGSMVLFPYPSPEQNTVTTQPVVGTHLLGGTVPLMGGPTSPLGQNIPPALAQYWNQLMQNFPQNARGQQAVPTIGQPYPGVTNPIWGSGQTSQPQVTTQTQGQNPWG
jgi:hypothetical protein